MTASQPSTSPLTPGSRHSLVAGGAHRAPLQFRSAMDTFQTQLAKKLSEALAKADLPNAGELTPATDARFGDYQTNAAMVLAKQRGENPRELAARILQY